MMMKLIKGVTEISYVSSLGCFFFFQVTLSFNNDSDLQLRLHYVLPFLLLFSNP